MTFSTALKKIEEADYQQIRLKELIKIAEKLGMKVEIKIKKIFNQ